MSTEEAQTAVQQQTVDAAAAVTENVKQDNQGTNYTSAEEGGQQQTVFDVDPSVEQQVAQKQEELNKRNESQKGQQLAALASFRTRAQAVSSFIKDKSVVMSEKMKNVDVKKYQQTAAGALGTMGARVQTTSNNLYQQAKQTTAQAAESVRKLANRQTLEAQCRLEASNRPCPRVVLCSCHFLCATGLKDEGLFTDPIQQDIIDQLTDIFNSGNGAVLFPAGTTPQIVSAFLKYYLANLPEPLLTFKLLPGFLNCVENLDGCKDVVASLPQPNFNALVLIMDTCARVAAEAESNGSSTETLASSLAPCLGWHPLPKANPAQATTPTGQAEGEPLPQDGHEDLRNLPLDPQELNRLEIVLAYLIQEFKGQQS